MRQAWAKPAPFLSTPSARRATSRPTTTPARTSHFYPRPPRGGRPVDCQITGCAKRISIHALREEGDRSFTGFCVRFRNFYPRPPRGGRPGSTPGPLSRGGFLSTPSARRATHIIQIVDMLDIISIHALREEGDPPAAAPVSSMSDFYPRPPRGGRPPEDDYYYILRKFLSTPSARRATP